MKTKNDIKIILSLSMTLLPMTASSYYECLKKEEIVKQTKVKSVSACYMSKAPRLIEGYLNYPKFQHSPQLVKYWEAEVQKVVTVEKTVLQRIMDMCARGKWGYRRPQVIEQKEYKKPYKTTLSFKLDNPNTDPEIAASYLLAPMTEDEVQVALQNTMTICQEADVAYLTEY